MIRTGMVLFMVALLLIASPCFGGDNEKKLWEAVKKGDMAVVKEMFAAGMNANSSLILKQDKPLMTAINAKQVDMAKFLVESGADVNYSGNQGLNALILSAGVMPVEFIGYLLEKGAKIDAADEQGGTPLHWAAYHGRTDAIEFLLSKGADLKISGTGFAPTANGGTAMHKAAMKNRAEAVKLLAKKGLSVNDQNPQGFTPIMKAAQAGGKETVEALISLKADLSKVNNEKKTVLVLAKEKLDERIKTAKKYKKYDEANPNNEIKGLIGVIELLEKAGAK